MTDSSETDDILDRINAKFRGTTFYEGRQPTLLGEAAAEIERLRADKRRLDWLETERERETGPLDADYERSLFRRNMPITRDAIDAAIRDEES